MALSNEYNIKIEKINDSFIESSDCKFKFLIGKDNYWRIAKKRKDKYLKRLFLKIYIILLHISYFLLPFFKSYLIGDSNNRPRFLLGNKINNFEISKIISEAKHSRLIISGWGLRDWDLVKKYKRSIVKDLKKNLGNLNVNQGFLNAKKYVFVHIRRGDFLDVENLKQINFSNEIWTKSIKKLCFKTSIMKVVIFSDSEMPNEITLDLKKSGIKVINPDKNYKNFLLNFMSYISNAGVVLCNASTLTLSLSFLYHDEIYLPSKKNNFLQKVLIDEAHNSFPTNLNWK